MMTEKSGMQKAEEKHKIPRLSNNTLLELAISEKLSYLTLTRIFISSIAILLAIYHVITAFIGPLPSWQHRMLHVGVVLVLIFCYQPYKKNAKWNIFFDGIPLLISSIVTVYTVSTYPDVVMRSGSLILSDYVIGMTLILLIVEGTRRMLGIAMTAITIFFLAYVYFGQYISGMLGHPGFSFSMFIQNIYVSTTGILGAPIYVSSTVLVIFLIFGSFLLRSGAGSVFIDFAYAITGSMRGGPALTSIIASALIGSITGAGLANVAITGTFTIPLMTKVGYDKNFAGAVEAVGSQGGQIMPPIMGASAFIIAEFLGIRYITVVIHAIVPALLYFIIAAMVVYTEACKLNLHGLPKDELPDWKKVLFGYGYLFLPLIIIVACLIYGYSPMKAGFYGIISSLILSMFRKATRMSIIDFFAALEDGIRNTLAVAVTCACCGIIVGSISLTGVGLRFSRFAMNIAGEQLVLVLLFVMIACIILGMGMTTVSAYILAAVLGAPALVKLGVPDVAAHFFVFYFAIISGLTPPVALTSYAAAGVARGDPQQTSYYSLKLAIGGFIVPFLIIFNKHIIMIGSSGAIILSVFTAILGSLSLAVGIQGYLFGKLSITNRIIICILGLALMFMKGYTSLIAIPLIILIAYYQYNKKT